MLSMSLYYWSLILSHKKLLFIFVCLFLWIGFYAQAEAGRSSSLDHTIEQKKLVALSFLKNNQFDAAYNSYMSLLREDPTDDEINYGLMLSAYHLKNYTAALLAGERLVDKYPADANLRLHMARTYLALKERESAKYELEEARKYNPDISPDQVEDILKSLEKSDKRLFVNGSISTGIIYDTNSNQGPSSNTLNLGIFDGLVVEGVKSKESWANYLGTNLDLSYRLGENSPWWLVSDLAIYQRWNTSAGIQTNNQFTWGRVAAGVRRVGEKSMIDFRINHNQGLQTHKIGEDELVHSGGPELMLVFFPHPDLQFISSFSWELRDYKVSDGRDGQYWTVSQYARYFLERRGIMLWWERVSQAQILTSKPIIIKHKSLISLLSLIYPLT